MRSLARILCLVLWVCEADARGKLNYTIERTWNGDSIAPSKPVTLNISSTESGDLKLEISAPYFGDPSPDAPSGQPVFGLWNYEVVEVFFLNNDGLYLEVQIGPRGHHTVLLLNGERNVIRHSLPLEPSTTINGDNWNVSVIIPRRYLPPKVTKFNAYAIHGTGENREYWSLYPTDGSTTDPDFHNLDFFKPINFNTIDPTLSMTTLSNIWHLAITKGKLMFSIETTWNGESIAPSKPVALNISTDKLGGLKLEISAPYFGDLAPDAPSGQFFPGLYKYEVVEVYFLNDDGQYLQVQIGPHGHYIVLLLNGVRNVISHPLPLEPSTTINGDNWNVSVIIPRSYLPPKVTKFNAYAIHGTGENREYWSLYPTDGSTTDPDFHNLNFFKLIDFNTVDPTLSTTTLSNIWDSSITNYKLKYSIETTWDGRSIAPNIPVEIYLSLAISGDIKMEVTAPYFGDPVPETHSGHPVIALSDYEVVAAFFLNDDDQYLEVEVGPHGQFGHHMVVLLNGRRNRVHHSLSLELSTTINGGIWTGTAIIPKKYLPPKVSKFNAYAAHGSIKNRQYWSLYPTDGSTLEADFHKLEFFQPIDLSAIDPELVTSSLSSLWRSVITGHKLNFAIENNWNGGTVWPVKPVLMNLSLTNSGDIKMKIRAPYFGDPAPDGSSGLPFLGLWDHEVVQAFFLNDDDQYLEVEIGPHGQHIVLLYNGKRNTIRHSLPLNVTAEISKKEWTATAIIPKNYLPPKVTKFNAYSLHGIGEFRQYWALYPADGSAQEPDLHNLAYFKPIDMSVLDSSFASTTMSTLWTSAIQGIIRYTVSRQWNYGPPVVAPSEYSLQGFEGGVEVNYTIKATDSYPFKNTVLVFENAEGESLKINLRPNRRYKVEFYTNRINELEKRPSVSIPEIDYRVDDIIWTDDTTTLNKGSVMIPPSFFPPKVNLINVYVLFGIEVLQVEALEPIKDETEAADPRPDLENLRHFTSIDFDNLVESNEEYSLLWKQLLGIQFQEPINKVRKPEKYEYTTIIPEEHEIKITIAPTNSRVLEKQKPNDVPNIVESQTIANQETSSQEENSTTTGIPIIFPNIAEGLQQTVKDSVVDQTTQIVEPIKIKRENAIELSTISSINEIESTTVFENNMESIETEDMLRMDFQDILSRTTSEMDETTMLPDLTTNVATLEFEEQTALPAIRDLIASKVRENHLQKLENAQSLSTITPETTETTPEAETEQTTVDQISDESNLEPSNQLGPRQGGILIPDGFMPELKFTQFERPLDAPINDFEQSPERSSFQRRFEEPNSDKNTIPIDLNDLFNSENKFIDEIKDNLKNNNNKLNQLDVINQPELNHPDMPTEVEEALVNVFSLLTQDSPNNEELESALDALDKLSDAANETSPSSFEDENVNVITLEDIFGSDLLPPPHPICFEEGLVKDSIRCQVFYECVLENGFWEVYNWRCKRGHFFDAEKVACIKGYC